MALAYMCDRCKTLYIRNNEECSLRLTRRGIFKIPSCGWDDVDLCPECLKKLEKFMLMKEEDEQ